MTSALSSDSPAENREERLYQQSGGQGRADHDGGTTETADLSFQDLMDAGTTVRKPAGTSLGLLHVCDSHVHCLVVRLLIVRAGCLPVA